MSPVMRAVEFTARTKGLEKAISARTGAVIVAFLPLMFGLMHFASDAQPVEAIFVVSIAVGGLFLPGQIEEKPLQNSAGFIRVPFDGLCNHCGAKIIQK